VSVSRWIATAGATCLVAGSVGQFVQYLVSPIEEGVSAYAQVAQAAAHLARMRWAIPLDLFILLIAPAALYAGSLAGARVSKLAAAGAARAGWAPGTCWAVTSCCTWLLQLRIRQLPRPW
jgi:hypothetical protein